MLKSLINFCYVEDKTVITVRFFIIITIIINTADNTKEALVRSWYTLTGFVALRAVLKFWQRRRPQLRYLATPNEHTNSPREERHDKKNTSSSTAYSFLIISAR